MKLDQGRVIVNPENDLNDNKLIFGNQKFCTTN